MPYPVGSERVYIVAEAGVNHNGSPELAERLVDAAAEAGADAVKFQTFVTENEISRHAPKADYQKATTGDGESQFDMVKKLELDFVAHERIAARCAERGIAFLSTPFDLVSADMLLSRFRLERIKIASGELTNALLLLRIAAGGKKTILSTGMATLGEIESALAVLAFGYLQPDEAPGERAFQAAWSSEEGQRLLRDNVILLHCTSEYPCPFGEANLKAMETMRAAFGLPVGLSDHTEGIAVPIAAAALGAMLIEKHFTMDRSLPGPDHRASLEPDEMKRMIEGIRQVEQALGTGLKQPSPSEERNRVIVRKSLVASRPIRRGEVFTALNLAAKRPGFGISPMKYWEMIGRPSNRDYEEDEVIRESCW